MPVEISDWNDLDNVRNDLSGDYVLVNDLDSETDGYAGIGDDFEPIGFDPDTVGGTPFTGSIDGSGFAISDLFIEEPNDSKGGIGLIAQITGLVENLIVRGKITSEQSNFRYGGLAGTLGRLDPGEVHNCAADVDIDVKDGIAVGGLVGRNSFDGIITNSYAIGSVEGDGEVGGLVGLGDEGTIETSYAAGSVTGNNDVGGLVGRGSPNVIDSYWDTESSGQDTSNGGTGLTTSEMQGSEAETNMDGFDFNSQWGSVRESDGDVSADDYPILTARIRNWHDLDALRGSLDSNYELVNDLDSETEGYAGIGDDFEPIGFVSGNADGDPFSGVLDGNGFQISDLVIEENDSTEGGVAFITQVGNGGLVENLSVDGVVNSTIDDFQYGGLCGSVARDGTGTIQNCVSNVDVTVPHGSRVGGLVGQNDGTVTDSHATGSVEGNDRVGGLVGLNRDTITDSHVTGSVEGDDEYVGGLVGVNQDTVTDSYATGSVDGFLHVGGLLGYTSGPVTDSYATGSVVGEDEFIGGLVGRGSSGSIEASYATGSVEGDSDVGGLLGRGHDTPIEASYATGSVVGNSDVGGLVGDGNITVIDSYWDTESSGQDTSNGGTGLTTSEMQGSEAETNMDGFDFADVWSLVVDGENADGDGYPIVRGIDPEPQGDEQNLDITDFFEYLNFSILALVNSDSVEVRDLFVQVDGEVREVSEVFVQVGGGVEQL